MRLLLGLALGLALMAQPAVAGPKEEKKEAKAERKEQRSEPSAPAPADAAPPQRAPAEAASVPVEKKERPAKPKQQRRFQPPEPTPTLSPSPSSTTVPVANVPSPPAVPSAAPVPAASATPAPTAAPERPKRPARRERRSRRPSGAVLGFTAGASTTARAVPVATALMPFPRLRRPATRTAPRREKPRAATAGEPGAGPATTAVTRVVNVIPAPIRIALVGLIMLVVLLTVRARRLENQRQDLSEDLGLLQSALLPAIPERIGQAWISAAYRPADGLAAGGDFYDAFALDAHRTCLLVGDVAGHGRDAIPITADVRFTLRAYLEAGMAPRAALRATAAVIGPRLGGRLVTVVVAVFDSRTGRLTFAAAGHPPPLLAGIAERPVTVASSPAIGAGIPTGHRQTTVTLPAGATACFYTDGLADAKSGDRRLGPAGVAQYLASLGRRADARALVDRVVRNTESQPDDMAVCLIRPQLGITVPAEERVEELELDRPDGGRAMRFLIACGVPVDEAEVALEAANDLLPVVLEVRCGPAGGTVAVHRPDTAALPLS